VSAGDKAPAAKSGNAAALGELQSALQEHCDYLESVSADYLLSLPLAIRKRLSKLHETIAA